MDSHELFLGKAENVLYNNLVVEVTGFFIIILNI